MFAFSTGPGKLCSWVYIRIQVWLREEKLFPGKRGNGGRGPSTTLSFLLTWGLAFPMCGRHWEIHPRKLQTMSLPATEPFPGVLCVSALTVVHWRHCRASHIRCRDHLVLEEHQDLGLALASLGQPCFL